MAANRIDNTILGTILNGQGSVIAACGWLAAAVLAVFAEICGLYMSRGYWYALSLKRMPAAMTPIAATCWKNSDRRSQRHPRWMSGVVVDPGTVGVV